MSQDTHNHSHEHDHSHSMSHELPFWRKYIFSTDHKVIGLQYGITAVFFLLFGFGLMLLMRWQLAFPKQAIPLIGKLFTEDGVLSPELYNQFGAMHGTIMVFLGVVPLGVGAFGNYLIPLQIGAGDMAFPLLNELSYWLYVLSGVILLGAFFAPGGAPGTGWTADAAIRLGDQRRTYGAGKYGQLIYRAEDATKFEWS